MQGQPTAAASFLVVKRQLRARCVDSGTSRWVLDGYISKGVHGLQRIRGTFLMNVLEV